MAQPLPSSVTAYLKGMHRVLPPGCIASGLKELQIFRFADAYPQKGESLRSWIVTGARNDKGRVPVTLIVGESRSRYRQARQPSRQTPADMPWLTMACTCDGAAGTLALFGLLRRSGLSLNQVDVDAVIDEWTLINPNVLRRVKNSHLVVVGTPEVNILAAFLHALVRDFHFGQRAWPPDLASTGDRLFVGGTVYLRSPYASEVNDCGGAFLLKNPWNPNYRVFWVGGLTGRGTWHVCSLVASDWKGCAEQADRSIGIILGRDILANTLADSKGVGPQDWLAWTNGEPTWRSSRPTIVSQTHSGDREKHREKKHEPKKLKSEKHVFISYCHRNRKKASRLHDDLVSAGLDVWWDKDIKPGEDSKEAIRTAMNNSYTVVVCLSSQLASKPRSGMYPEIRDAVAVFRDARPGSAFLIPVRLSRCEIPSIEIDATRTLQHLQYVDLFPAKNWESGLEQLVVILRRLGHAFSQQPRVVGADRGTGKESPKTHEAEEA